MLPFWINLRKPEFWLFECRLGYRFYRSATYYEFGRDAYESIVICSFMILMCNFLGSEAQLHHTFKKKVRGGLIFPLCCIKVNPSSWVTIFFPDRWLTLLVFCRNNQMVYKMIISPQWILTGRRCVLQFAIINRKSPHWNSWRLMCSSCRQYYCHCPPNAETPLSGKYEFSVREFLASDCQSH